MNMIFLSFLAGIKAVYKLNYEEINKKMLTENTALSSRTELRLKEMSSMNQNLGCHYLIS